ncbi:MAG TPA: isocitrate lyase/phosphoenolpyruvate mutase family protein [Thermoanaerobaculia bacterium]|nr:isocitrate lyase/phosphoenolpyruvate mutase family protein [Thermoanaerobaculia bacterium]
MIPTQSERATRFAELHRRPGQLLLLPNAWDVASALVFEAAGFPAVATTSAGLAWASGYRDGEGLPLGELVATVARMAAVLRVPLSVDFEAGYGRTPEEIAAAVRAVIAAGAVGINLEDRDFSGGAPLRDLTLQGEILRAVREAAEGTGVPLFVNARTDIYLGQVGAPGERRAHTLERLRAFVAAGADGVFVPALSDPDDIRAVADGAGAPLNVLLSRECRRCRGWRSSASPA